MIKCIEEFYRAFGLKIGVAKSKLFVSPNVNNAIARSLSTLSSILLTNNLGTYLGVSIVHGRVTKNIYAHLVNKVLKKLADWKDKVLSQASRRTLIQSTTNSIPLHTMQTVLLPLGICKKLDQINCNFLWGGSAKASRNHLMSWDKVCQPKFRGGFGIEKITRL